MPERNREEEVHALIRQRLQNALDAWNRGDVAEYVKIFKVSESTALVSDQEILEGFDTIRLTCEKQAAENGTPQSSLHIVDTLYLGSNAGVEYAYVLGQSTEMHGEHEVRENVMLLMTCSPGEEWCIYKGHSA